MERRLFKNALALVSIFLILKGLSGFESHFKAREEFIVSSAGRFYPVFSDADKKHVQSLIPENGSPKVISADLQQEITVLSLKKGWKIDNNKVIVAEYQENWKAFSYFVVLCSGVLLGGMLLISLIKTPRYSGVAVYKHLKTIRLNKKLLHPA
jgi:hypothetical protein